MSKLPKYKGISPERIREAVKNGGFKAFTGSKAKRKSLVIEYKKKQLHSIADIEYQNKIILHHQNYFNQLENHYNQKFITPEKVYEKLDPVKKNLLKDYFSILDILKKENKTLLSILNEITKADGKQKDRLINKYLEQERKFNQTYKIFSEVWQNNKMRIFGP